MAMVTMVTEIVLETKVSKNAWILKKSKVGVNSQNRAFQGLGVSILEPTQCMAIALFNVTHLWNFPIGGHYSIPPI